MQMEDRSVVVIVAENTSALICPYTIKNLLKNKKAATHLFKHKLKPAYLLLFLTNSSK